MRIQKFLATALLVLATAGMSVLSGHAAADEIKPDSTSIKGASALTNSNCPNLNDAWYGAGQVPSGYYKANGDGNCYPIPACPGGTAWNGTSQTCASICAAGTSWNGSTCATTCTGGMVWNGASCSCPASLPNWNGASCQAACSGGYTWNGASCAANSCAAWSTSSGACGYTLPSTASGQSGSAATFTAGYTGTVTANCTAGTWGGVSASCAQQSCPAAAPQSGACRYNLPATAGGSGASAANTTAGYAGSVSATCSAGAWTGLSASCSQLPPGVTTTVNGSTAAATVYAGSTITLGWNATNSPTSLAMSCGSIGYWGLAGASGTGYIAATDAMVAYGTQHCATTASNAGGSASSNVVPLTVACSPGTAYSGGSCKSAAHISCVSGGGVWNGSSCQSSCNTPVSTNTLAAGSGHNWHISCSPSNPDKVFVHTDVSPTSNAPAYVVKTVSTGAANEALHDMESTASNKQGDARTHGSNSVCPPGSTWIQRSTYRTCQAAAGTVFAIRLTPMTTFNTCQNASGKCYGGTLTFIKREGCEYFFGWTGGNMTTTPSRVVNMCTGTTRAP